MKKPIFSEEQRRNWLVPELEVAKMKFRREFDRSWHGRFNYKIIDWLAKCLKKIKLPDCSNR